MIEQQTASREKDDKARFMWKRQGATGLFFINIESNSFISSIIVVSGGVVMCMEGLCWRKRALIIDMGKR
jgi:hypothetical protein